MSRYFQVIDFLLVCATIILVFINRYEKILFSSGYFSYYDYERFGVSYYYSIKSLGLS